MWLSNKVFKEDLEYVNRVTYFDWSKFDGKTFFITGATGLIGYTFVCALAYRNEVANANIKIIALVRDLDKAKERFKELDVNDELQFVVGDMEHVSEVKEQVDYIVHCAAPTASAFFVEHPVETISAIVDGTMNMLELAKKHSAEMVFLSSMEVYGAPKTDVLLDEGRGIDMDSMALRSSYPYAKRLAECLCMSYVSEYGVKVKVVRLAQTFGPGVSKNDNRVFAQFAKCVENNEDIVLLTDGSTKRMYLYTMDAVGAILCVLQKGVNGQAYNVADKNTYCSIRQMAEIVAHNIARDKIKVVIKCDNIQTKYPPTLCLKLDTSKLEKLGWQATYVLQKMGGGDDNV